MNSSMDARSMLISPPFENCIKPSVAGSVVARGSLTADERRQMYNLLETYFAGMSQTQFDADLAEKETVILLRSAATGKICGFSTFMRITASMSGREVVAFFSGDTIVAQQFRGEMALSRLWSQTAFAQADRIISERPATRVYWFLICSGYKTFRFLPVFFREFYPNPGGPTPANIQAILDTFAEGKFGSQYQPDSGIVRLCPATPLRSGVADLTEERLSDPLVAFFARMNPGHAKGDELACITEITRSNLTRAGHRMFGAGEDRGFV